MFWIFDSFTYFVVFYFVFLIFIGSFFLINLTLAVIKAKFTDNQSNNRPVIEEVEVEMKCDLFLLKTYHKK